MNVVGFITRPELGLADLVISSGAYRIVSEGADFGPVTWRKQEATSIFMHGSIPVYQVKSGTVINLGVRVLGSSQSQLAANIDTLIKAVSQWTYNLSLSLEGTSYTWTCYSADYAVGGSGERFNLLDVDVRLVIPRSPIPIAGPV